ncbi:MAG TPA: lactonase family protein, partial [Planctomycetaceae bacterium]|nr:lactonase family protein [Planctomycetaceae bacterium]
VYFGTYSGKDSQGVYQTTFDSATGKLGESTLAGEAVNPSFVAIHPTGKFLYAVGEIADFEGKKTGGVTAFAIDAASGQLTKLNQQSSEGTGPCHIIVDKTGNSVLVANYGGGSAVVLPIEPGGTLRRRESFVVYSGNSIDPKRQKEPHAHSINLDPSNQFAFIADLGTDEIHICKFDQRTHVLTFNDPHNAKVAPGSGPRHFAFHPSGKTAYVINELSNTVTAFAFDAVKGSLTETQTITTLPKDFSGTSYTAEVVAHPSGKFLYGSNRGHDSLAVFQIDAAGKLTAAGHVPTGGKTPRNFNVDPTGKWVLAGNQGSGTVTVFAVNQDTGMLTPTGQSIAVGSPVCVRFLAMK